MADPSNSAPVKDEKDSNLFVRAKEGREDIKLSEKSPRHDKETHGKNDDIDENTPVDEVKGPNMFQRVKEEVEAVVEAILPNK